MWWGKRADPLVVVGKGMGQNLGGYISAEILVMRTIDFPHTDAAQLLLNAVVGEGLANHGRKPYSVGLCYSLLEGKSRHTPGRENQRGESEEKALAA